MHPNIDSPRTDRLTREEELELARRVEEGERAILRALITSPVALRELAALGEALAAKRLRASELLRCAGDEELSDEPITGSLVEALEQAGALARAMEGGAAVTDDERLALLDRLERLALHRRVLDRIVRALRAAHGQREGTAAVLEAIEEGRRVADGARATLVASNLRLVIMLARPYLHRGLSFDDLVQEANIGLMRAIDKFDHRRGLRFGTYATWWVKQQMARAIADQAKIIRVPIHMVESRRKVRRARRDFEQEHGRAPGEAEIVEKSGLAPEKVRAVDAIAPEPLSLHAPAGHDGDAELGDLVPDATTPAPDRAIAEQRMREQTRALLDLLTPREREILAKRFGLDDSEGRTLEEIGRPLSLSRERVRQIEAEALRKLRDVSTTRELHTYLAG